MDFRWIPVIIPVVLGFVFVGTSAVVMALFRNVPIGGVVFLELVFTYLLTVAIAWNFAGPVRHVFPVLSSTLFALCIVGAAITIDDGGKEWELLVYTLYSIPIWVVYWTFLTLGGAASRWRRYKKATTQPPV